jgi:VWFA-related protein
MKRCSTLGITPVLAALLVFAGAERSKADETTLRSNTRLVQVSVVAMDSKSRPVVDLKREDFQLFDDKKRQDLRVFSVDRVEQASSGAQTPPGDGVFTNTTNERSVATGITVIVLDSLNTQWTDQSQATKQVLRFLRQIQPGDRVAIYSLGYGGFRVLHDFTRDASDLVERLANWTGEIPRPESGLAKPDLGSALATVLTGRDARHLASQFMGGKDIHYVPGTLKALQAIARRLEGIPGRKNLIWISDGFPELEWGNLVATSRAGPLHDYKGPVLVGETHDSIGDTFPYRNDLLGAMKFISEANIAVYPVEARGLLTEMPEDGDPWGFIKREEILYQQSTQEAMLEIAQKTGGRAFLNDNHVADAIREAIEDSRVTYTLGFYVDANHIDGKFHNISIKLPGRRDVTLRYRSGYVNEVFSPADRQRRARDLDQAFWSPLDANAIPLKGKVENAGNGRANIDLNIGLENLGLTPEDGKRKGEVDILILQRNETGEVFGRVNETIQMGLREETYEKFLAVGVPYQHAIELDPRSTVIRVIVRDAANGNLGSVTIPATAVPN